MTDLASNAFRLALRGLYIFPLAAGSKAPPRGTHGHLDASHEVDVVRAWWSKHPKRNIGVATGSRSKISVLDVDPQHRGDKSLLALTRSHGPLPPTISVETPSGGCHFWFRWPADAEIRNSTSKIGPGLDVRGEGGAVVCPPSVLADGRRYRWMPGPKEIFEAPKWLILLAAPPPQPRPEPTPINGDLDRYIAAAIAGELRQLQQAKEGTRNWTLNKVAFVCAGFVLAGAIPESWALTQLESRAVDIGLALPEARRTIQSAFAAATPRALP
jgi:hypothetical protein